MDSEDQLIGSVPIFYGRDFSSWEEEIRLMLMAKGLWGIVTGEETAGKDQALYSNKQQRAYAIIASGLSKSCRDCIRNIESTDPKEAWAAITARFSGPSAVAKMATLDCLFNLRATEDIDVREYISQFNRYVAKLNTYKVVMSEDVLVCLLLRGLPETYKLFRAQIRMTNELKVDLVLQLLHAEVELREGSADRGGEQLLNTRAIARTQGRNRRGPTRAIINQSNTCGVCHREGHTEETCWEKHPELAPVCARCRGMHYTRRCRNPGTTERAAIMIYGNGTVPDEEKAEHKDEDYVY